MISVTLVYDKDSDKELFLNSNLSIEPIIELYNMNTLDGRKKGFKIKGIWSAKKNPFIVISEDNKPIKCFYSENNFENNALIQFINEYSRNNE